MYYITGFADTGRTDRETHSVRQKEEPLSGIQQPSNRHHWSGWYRGAAPHPCYRDLIIMIVWTGLLHAYTLWTVSRHKHGKLWMWVCVWGGGHVCGMRARCLCSGVLQVRCCRCAVARDRGCWNAVELPVQWMLMWCTAKMIWAGDFDVFTVVSGSLYVILSRTGHALIHVHESRESPAFICIDPNTRSSA